MKRYVKKFLTFFFILIISFLFASNNISAYEEIYLNKNNIPINQNLYNKLRLIGKTEQEIEYLTYEEVNEYEQINILNVETKTFYIKVDQNTGKEELISERQYENDLLKFETKTFSINGCGPNLCFKGDDGSGGVSGGDSDGGSENSHTTPNSDGYKTITLTLTKLNSTNALVHLNVKWDKMPSSRQQDVISISFPDHILPVRETITDSNDKYYGSYFTKFKGSMFTKGITCDAVEDIYSTICNPFKWSPFSQYDRYTNTKHYSEGRTKFDYIFKKTRTLDAITFNSRGHWNDDVNTISLGVKLLSDDYVIFPGIINNNYVSVKQVKEISINLEVQIYIDNINYTMFQVVGSYIHFTEKVTFGWDSIYIGWPPSVQIQLPKYEGKYDTIKVTSDI